jgi:hypothetical protein
MCFRTGRKIFQGAGSEQGPKSNALEGERDGFFDGPAYLTHHRDRNTPLFARKGPNDFEVDFGFLFANLKLESQLIRDLSPKAPSGRV